MLSIQSRRAFSLLELTILNYSTRHWIWQYFTDASVLLSRQSVQNKNYWESWSRNHHLFSVFVVRQSILAFSDFANWRLTSCRRITIKFWFVFKHSNEPWPRVTPSYESTICDNFLYVPISSFINSSFRDLGEEHFLTGVNTILATWSRGVQITTHARAIWRLIKVPRGKITVGIDGSLGYTQKQSLGLSH